MAAEFLTFYQDRFRGGVTGGGISLPTMTGPHSGTITVDIAAGSTIRKAYLFAGRHGTALPLNVNFNGSPQPFNPSNQAIVPNFFTSYHVPAGNFASVHIRDVTNQISPALNSYPISFPSQAGSSGDRYEDFYLYITFNNPLLPFVNAYAFINKLGFNLPILSYPLSFSMPISNARPVALSLMSGYCCYSGDFNIIGINSSLGPFTLGNIFGANPNTPPCLPCGGPTCAGPHGDFSYYNSVFTGFNGNSNNLAMSGSDALSNVQTRLTNGDTAFTVTATPQPLGNATNSTWALFVTYMDDSAIYECQPCGDYNVTNVTSTAARLNWRLGCPISLPSSYVNTVQYRVFASPTWTTTTVTSATFLDIINLLPNTVYEWQVINLDNGGAQCAPGPILTFQTF